MGNFILLSTVDQVSKLCLFVSLFLHSSFSRSDWCVCLFLFLFLSPWCNHRTNPCTIQRLLLLLHWSMGKCSDPTASIVFHTVSFEDDGINWISSHHASPLDSGSPWSKRWVSCVVDSKSHEKSSPCRETLSFSLAVVSGSWGQRSWVERWFVRLDIDNISWSVVDGWSVGDWSVFGIVIRFTEVTRFRWLIRFRNCDPFYGSDPFSVIDPFSEPSTGRCG